MKLVLIEGPGKKDSVQHYLGKGYKVMPTFGHCRDLPAKTLGVDVEHNFEPQYVIVPDHKKTVDAIKKEVKNAEAVYFASDPDREGEAIAWHMCNILGIDPKKANRITYNEISESAVNEAIKNPRPIDDNLVNAQQARRVLDRLVGYKISPILCKKIQNKLSAGRVQSVTLRLVVDREREIENFKPEEYWTLQVILNKKDGKKESFKAILNTGKKVIKSSEEMNAILSAIEGQDFVVTNVKNSVTKSHPSAPFTTSTMQQDALNKLGMSLKVTSSTAQVLYEGVEIQGQGKIPLVTYIRTDSVRVAPEAQAKARKFINEKYGEKYVVKSPRIFKNKKDAQDAHEAIRPISLDRKPEDLKDKMPKNEYRLYKLIYDRFLASQMADATYDSLSVDIDCNGYQFKTTGRTMTFDGYTAVYNNQTDEGSDEKLSTLPKIEKGEVLSLKEKKPEQKWTKPPARYTEASLVKTMEEKGIGRPSTYTQSVTTLFYRNYVEHNAKTIVPTELGKVVVDMLIKFFPNIMDISFTAEMEDSLDDIEYEGKDWRKMIREFYTPFIESVKIATKDGTKSKIPDEVSDVVCDKCGAMMVIKNGRFGKFLACPNYPTCKNTRPLVEEKKVDAKCPLCGKNIKTLRSKKNKIFYGCEGYPECKFMSWDIPANEKCPNCGEELIVKLYKNSKVIKCNKCNYSRKEGINVNNNNDLESEDKKSLSISEEKDILNRLDEGNEI